MTLLAILAARQTSTERFFVVGSAAMHELSASLSGASQEWIGSDA